MHLRRLALLIAFAAVVSGAGPAHAQTTTPTTPTTPTTTAFTNSDFTVQIQKRIVDKKGVESWVLLPDIEAKYYFDKARCECKTPVRILVDVSSAGLQKRALVGMSGGPSAQGNLQLWVGPSGCLDMNKSVRETSHCTDLGATGANTEPMLSALFLNARPGAWTVTATVDQLFVASGNEKAGTCEGQFAQKLWLWLPSASGDAPFLQNDQAPQLNVAIDGAPPPAPTGLTMTPGNEALNIGWNRAMGIADLNGYIVFCSRAGQPVFADSYYRGNEFHTQQTECNMGDSSSAGVGVFSDVNRGMAINAPPEIHNGNSAYACSPLLTSVSSYRIRTLQNSINYIVGVAAVDATGNISPINTAVWDAPIVTRDFYTAYRDDGGAAEGGFCAYARRGRPTPWTLAGAGLAVALALRARRRS